MAAGSHAQGVYDFHIGAGAGGIEIKDPLDGRWTSGPFSVGDVLIFHSMTVHKGVPNRSDRLRMSIDVRFQLVSEPFNFDNAQPDGQPLTWEEVYAGWKSDELKYYWKRLALTSKPFDRTWFDKRDQLAFELGEAGDPRAGSVLQRIVARDLDPEKRARAARLLARIEGQGALRSRRHVAERQPAARFSFTTASSRAERKRDLSLAAIGFGPPDTSPMARSCCISSRVAIAMPIESLVKGLPVEPIAIAPAARQRLASGMSAVMTIEVGPTLPTIQSSAASNPSPTITRSNSGFRGTARSALATT